MSSYVQDFQKKNRCFFNQTAISISSNVKIPGSFSGPWPRLLNRSSSSCGDCGDTGDCGELDLATADGGRVALPQKLPSLKLTASLPLKIGGKRRRDKASFLQIGPIFFVGILALGRVASWEFKAITQQKMVSPNGDAFQNRNPNHQDANHQFTTSWWMRFGTNQSL